MKKKISEHIKLFCEKEIKDKIAEIAKSKRTMPSKMIMGIVDKYLLYGNDVIPVVLKVPTELRNDKDGLKKWLDARVDAIVDALFV